MLGGRVCDDDDFDGKAFRGVIEGDGKDTTHHYRYGGNALRSVGLFMVCGRARVTQGTGREAYIAT